MYGAELLCIVVSIFPTSEVNENIMLYDLILSWKFLLFLSLWNNKSDNMLGASVNYGSSILPLMQHRANSGFV